MIPLKNTTNAYIIAFHIDLIELIPNCTVLYVLCQQEKS